MSINNTKLPAQYLQEMRELRDNIADGNAVWADASDIRAKYGLSPVTTDTIRKGAFLYDEFNQSGWISRPTEANEPVNREVYTLNPDGTRTVEKIVGLSDEDITDPQALLKAHGFNPANFKLVGAKNSKWQQGDGKGGTKCLYSSRITVKPVSNGLDYEDIRKYFDDFKSNHVPVDHGEDYGKGREIMVFGHFDVHMGRISSEYETGYEYNLEIAEENMLKTTDEIVEKAKKHNLERIVYVIGQDFFNSSSTGYTTSQSHLQDNATTFNTIFKFGTGSLIKCIDKLSDVAPVYVVLSVGNHARFEESAMADVIAAYYKDDDNILVDSSPLVRKYLEYGCNCIGLTHGSDEKERIYTLMQAEAPEIWGRTNTHVWLTGHIHHRTVLAKEDSSCCVFSMSAMARPDRWTTKSGYTMAACGCAAFVFDFNKGLSGIEFSYS